jgi:hypothetical protein
LSSFLSSFVQGGNEGGREVARGFYEAGRQTLHAIFHPLETAQNISNLTHALVDDFPGTVANIWNNMSRAFQENPSRFMGGVAWNALWSGGTLGLASNIPNPTVRMTYKGDTPNLPGA